MVVWLIVVGWVFIVCAAEESRREHPGTLVLREIEAIIHVSQHPPSCQDRRLAVLQMKSSSFEGTGSLYKQILAGLAVSIHSNRTLIYGLGLPYAFEHTQDLWDGQLHDKVNIEGQTLDCSQGELAGKGFGCFFEPLTSCYLSDAAPGELIQFSHNTYNNSARIMVPEIARKGLSLYMAPSWLYDQVFEAIRTKYGEEDLKRVKTYLVGRENHLWLSAIASYSFRLKPELKAQFDSHYEQLVKPRSNDVVWGVHVRHGDLKAMPHVYKYKTVFDFKDYFEEARRRSHAVGRTPDIIYVATDSIEADRVEELFQEFMQPHLVSRKASSSDVAADPNEAADDDDIEEEEKEEESVDAEDDDDNDESCGDDGYDEWGGECQASKVKAKSVKSVKKPLRKPDKISSKPLASLGDKSVGWFGRKVPRVVSISNKGRYRTEHGSHTVASNGGCQKDENYDKRGMKCALEYDFIIKYQTMEEHRSVPRSYRIMRVLLESIEDIYFLSKSSSLFATGSSYYSTLSSYLVWANTKCEDILNTVAYLDSRAIESGLTPTAHLHGMNLLNSTYGLDPKKNKNAGAERWKIYTKQFISGMQDMHNTATLFPTYHNRIAKLGPSFLRPWDAKYRMHIKDLIPHIHEPHFYYESNSWRGNVYVPLWPGACPGLQDELNMSDFTLTSPSTRLHHYTSRISEVVNLGVEYHTALNLGMAMQCWNDAITVIDTIIAAVQNALQKRRTKSSDLESTWKVKNLQEMKEIAVGNLKSLRVHAYAELVIDELSGNTNAFQKRKREMEDPLGIFRRKRREQQQQLQQDASEEAGETAAVSAAAAPKKEDVCTVNGGAAAICKLTKVDIFAKMKRIHELNNQISILTKELEKLSSELSS